MFKYTRAFKKVVRHIRSQHKAAMESKDNAARARWWAELSKARAFAWLDVSLAEFNDYFSVKINRHFLLKDEIARRREQFKSDELVYRQWLVFLAANPDLDLRTQREIREEAELEAALTKRHER